MMVMMMLFYGCFLLLWPLLSTVVLVWQCCCHFSMASGPHLYYEANNVTFKFSQCMSKEGKIMLVHALCKH